MSIRPLTPPRVQFALPQVPAAFPQLDCSAWCLEGAGHEHPWYVRGQQTRYGASPVERASIRLPRSTSCDSRWYIWPSQYLIQQTEEVLEKWKHPDPYVHPTAPGGMLKTGDSIPERNSDETDIQVPSTSATCRLRSLLLPLISTASKLVFGTARTVGGWTVVHSNYDTRLLCALGIIARARWTTSEPLAPFGFLEMRKTPLSLGVNYVARSQFPSVNHRMLESDYSGSLFFCARACLRRDHPHIPTPPPPPSTRVPR